jgi:Subtilase family/PKD-like domain
MIRSLVVVLSLLAAPLRAESDAPLSQTARAQIQALLAEKDSRTAAQAKVDSNLLYAIRQSQGRTAADGVDVLQTGVDVGTDGRTVVDLVARVNDGLLARIQAVNGLVLSVNRPLRAIRALVPLAQIEALAADPAVIFVNPRQDATTSRGQEDGPVAVDDLGGVNPALRRSLAPGFAGRAARVRQRLEQALGAGVTTNGDAIGNAVNRSEGDVTHRADLVRANFGLTGAGVKIGILSDGVTSLATLQASGDLPAVTVLAGQTGTGDEGSAMLEIVNDLAPNAQLYFATAFTSIASFAQNIRDLRAAGCDIIVDDVFYFVETPFQKGQAPAVLSTTNGGVVTQAVNDVTAGGALYFSSASNSGNKNDGTSGTWEGNFADGGAVAAPITGTGSVHDFGGAVTQNIISLGAGNPINLHWSDPLGGSANDYDLFVLNAAGTAVVASSTNAQTGTQDPYEQVAGTANVTNNRVVIVKRTTAAARFLHLGTNRARITVSTAGETHGHSTAVATGAFGVAATPAVGPYPAPFGPSNVVENFSSDGLRQLFFNSDSTAITPGNFLLGGGEVAQKPDLTAADGVSCAAPGFNPFFGTSAAAPHAGAIAGLLKSANLAFTPAQIRGFLNASAIDIEAPGIDRDSGVGIIDALSAAQATGVSPILAFIVGTVGLTEGAGNGNAFVEPGECGALTVALKNVSTTSAATSVFATLSSSTPGVTVDAATSAYPDVPASGTATNSRPFRFRLATTVGCPLFIDFTLSVSYTGAGSPQTLSFRVRAGLPALTFSSTLDAVAPTLPPGASSAVTGNQTNRVTRNGVASACGAAKTFPGTNTATTPQFDSYVFQNCSAQPRCVTVTLTQTSGTNSTLFSSAYLGSFTPATVATNYLADAGSSFPLGSPASYSFDVAAGATFVVNVNEVPGGAGIGAAYDLKVDGLCLPCQAYTTSFGCCPTINVSPGTLPAGAVSTPYTATLTASGGVAPYAFTASGLPAGLSASPAGAAGVTIAGTPTAGFSGNVTVSGTDANGCSFSQVLALTIACPAPPSSAAITAPALACQDAPGLSASVPDAGPLATYAWTITNGAITAGAGTRTVTFTSASATPLTLNAAVASAASCPAVNGSKDVTVTPGCFHTLAPCRVLDTRNAAGPYGAPPLQPGATRSFTFNAQCGVPSDARALALNVTETGPTAPGFVTVYPADLSAPLASVINFSPGQTRANNAVVKASGDGNVALAVRNGSTGTVDLIIDVVGYIK